MAGNGQQGYSGDDGPATAAKINGPDGIAIAPDGSVIIADLQNYRIRRIAPVLPGFTLSEYAISSADGSQIYRFAANGRHLATINALTGAVIYSFRYDESGLLQAVEDAYGNITTVERDSSGRPTAIVSPYGQRTSLAVNSEGWLERVSNTAGEMVEIGYTEGGLFNSLLDSRGGLHRFVYDTMGRLVRDEDPAGGVTSLERQEIENGYLVRRQEKIDENTEVVTTYQVETLSTGGQRMTNQGCCGGPIVSVVSTGWDHQDHRS